MKKTWLVPALAAAALLAGTGVAYGQRLSEMYIPIGGSPGLSGTHTVIGTISAVDGRSRLVTCDRAAGGTGSVSVKITDRTRVWLDRSKAGLPSQKGGFSDCLVGRRIEAKYVGNEVKPGGEADWIKVEVAPAAPK